MKHKAIPHTTINQAVGALLWQPWADAGWIVYQAPNDLLRAVNQDKHIATAKYALAETLLDRLEKGVFSYVEYSQFLRDR